MEIGKLAFLETYTSDDNGGIIEVHSKPNFGAVFRFSLPVMKEEKDE